MFPAYAEVPSDRQFLKHSIYCPSEPFSAGIDKQDSFLLSNARAKIQHEAVAAGKSWSENWTVSFFPPLLGSNTKEPGQYKRKVGRKDKFKSSVKIESNTAWPFWTSEKSAMTLNSKQGRGGSYSHLVWMFKVGGQLPPLLSKQQWHKSLWQKRQHRNSMTTARVCWIFPHS